MKTTMCAAILFAGFVAFGQAQAQNICEIELYEYDSEGQGLSADFSSVDTSTCVLGIETVVHVESSQGVVNIHHTCGHNGENLDTTTNEESNIISVVVGVYDRCLGTQVLSVRGNGTPTEFHINTNFKTANVIASLEGTDDLGGPPVSIDVDLIWNGVGKKERQTDHFVSNTRITQFRYMSSGFMRDAIVAGSVRVDGTDKTPLASTGGTIERQATRSHEEWN